MKKQTWIFAFLLVVFCLTFVQVQSVIVEDRRGRRVEEKILMLSDRPEVTKILAMGHDSTLADLLWIRAIQYFGGNFSTLNRPEKKPGMVNLFRIMTALDPHFASAYQFGGFVMNESIKDANLAVSFLLEGADNNPNAWRLRFDAGFIAFYQLQDYDTAKRLFVQTVFGENLAAYAVLETQGLLEGFHQDALKNDDLHADIKLRPSDGSIFMDLQESQTLGRIHIAQNTPSNQTFRLSKAIDAGATIPVFEEIQSVTQSGVYEFLTPFPARYLRLDSLTTEAEDGFFALSEIQVYGPRLSSVPSYVDRMAIEMDRAAGRFRVAWDQYRRYYAEAMEKGDRISAELAAQKLDDIYLTMVIEILDETIRHYLEKEGKLPSPSMRELVEEGYLQQVLQQRIAEDDLFRTETLPILLGPNQNVYNMLVTWDGASPIIMLPGLGGEEEKDWILVSRTSLVDKQLLYLDALQKLVNQYKEEYGTLPDSLEGIKTGRLFTGRDDIFEDPLGGEFYLDPQTGKVEARDPKY